MSAQAHFAVVPAAGHGRRMGGGKLMLPWKGQPILWHVLHAWQASCVSKVLVVARADDQAVLNLCARCDVQTVALDRPSKDMKESIQRGIRWIEAECRPRSNDRLLIAPADLPQLTSHLIDRIIAATAGRTETIIPRFGNRQGHPVALPWSLVPNVFQLADNEGINRVVAEHPKFYVDLPGDAEIDDVDTPDDYKRLSGRYPPELR